jgi:hypothetical protein
MDLLMSFASLLRATADTSLSAACSSGAFGTFGFYVTQLRRLKYPTPLSFQYSPVLQFPHFFRSFSYQL